MFVCAGAPVFASSLALESTLPGATLAAENCFQFTGTTNVAQAFQIYWTMANPAVGNTYKYLLGTASTTNTATAFASVSGSGTTASPYTATATVGESQMTTYLGTTVSAATKLSVVILAFTSSGSVCTPSASALQIEPCIRK